MPTPSGQNAHADENLVVGWTVQGSGQNQAAATGVPGAGYAQPSVGGVPSVFTGNGTPGVAGPASNNTSAGNTEQILVNPGYADVNPVYLIPGVSIPASMVPVPPSNVAFQNPTSLAATVVIAGGTLTSVKTAPFQGTTFTQVGTADGTYSVPAGGQIELTYTAAPTWAWTTASTPGAA